MTPPEAGRQFREVRHEAGRDVMSWNLYFSKRLRPATLLWLTPPETRWLRCHSSCTIWRCRETVCGGLGFLTGSRIERARLPVYTARRISSDEKAESPCLSRPFGTNSYGSFHPALKRWAILGCPSGTGEGRVLSGSGCRLSPGGSRASRLRIERWSGRGSALTIGSGVRLVTPKALAKRSR